MPGELEGQEALFDAGPPRATFVAPTESATVRRTKRNAKLLARGVHPATGLGLRPELGNCGACTQAERQSVGNSSFWKCRKHRLGMSGSEASDIRISWPACAAFESRTG